MGKYLLAIAIALGVLGGAGWAIDRNARTSERAQVEAEYKEKLDEAAKAAKKATGELEATLLSTTQERNERVKALHLVIKSLRDELRNRPSRPTDPSPTPPSGEACTGAQLYREDGEFLAGEAARADAVVIERDYYYKAYENARLILEAMRNKEQNGKEN